MKAPTITLALAALVMLCAFNDAQAVQNANLIGHWRFDEEFGDTAFDTAPSGTADNGVWVDDNTDGLGWGTGQVGGAANMSGGGNDYFLISAIDALDNATQLSLSAWALSDNPAVPYKGIFASRGVDSINNGSQADGTNWGLAKWPDQSLDARASNLSSNSHVFIDNDSDPKPIEGGVWTHYAMTWNGAASVDGGNAVGGQVKVYINGVLEADSEINNPSQMRPITEIVKANSWLLGEDSCCNGREWNGALDDFGMWDVALTDAEVAQIYTQATAVNKLDLADVAAPQIIPGDVDGDGVVELADDGHVIRDNYGVEIPANTSARKFGDLTGDGVVGADDFLEWRREWAGASLAAAASVPEPSSLALAAAGLIGLCSMASSRRRS